MGKKRKRPMNLELVEAYVERLRAALESPADFELVMKDLQSNPGALQPETAMICRLFYGDAPLNLSKRESLRRIRSRHESLMDFVAKSRAQTGKSAA